MLLEARSSPRCFYLRRNDLCMWIRHKYLEILVLDLENL